LRQLGTTNVYEAADSSYLQLIDYGSSLLVRSTDGTQMSYVKLQDEWRCTEIKDRSGNYLTINNYWWGDIANITDTLGRVVNFNYDANANLISITQNDRTQPWVTFGWGTVTMQPPLSGVVGSHNGEVIPVLAMVGFADGTYNKFLYNASGQVTRITHYASDSNPQIDNHELAHSVFNYEASDDTTRLSNIHLSAENWTGINGVPVPAEVITQYGLEGGKHTLSVVGDPNATVYKESYGTAWKRGLTMQSEVWAGGAQQKVTTTSWTQDSPDPNFPFQTNPRVIQTDILDSVPHHKLTTIGYDTFTLPSGTGCSLPSDVYEYDGTTVIRRTHTDYNKDSDYLNNRIIGLPQAQLLYEGASTLVAKTTYKYDWGGEYLQNTSAAPIQHYGSYSTDFVLGRGNLVDVLRWDVTDQNNESKATENRIGYDIDGSPLFTRDALGSSSRQTTISYSDKFSANGTILDAPRSFATFAYPTTVTNADGYSQSARYKYEFGAPTWKQTPQPNVTTNSPGPEQKFEYDSSARLQRVTSLVNDAYTRYDYGPNYVQAYATVNNVADEAYSAQIFDGLGRVIAAVRNHPGSAGGYSAVMTIYDQMGRAIQQSNPTETSASGSQWPATGDDGLASPQGHGWVYTQQTYDWKGRPLLTINPSITGNLNDTTTKEASYSACGCAGSEVVTLEDERERTQKVYSDVLGRQWKTEIMNGASIYSTTVSVYNGRDQVIRVKQYSGQAPAEASSTNVAASCPSGTCQESTMSYDGYGRLHSKHVPEQDASTATVYAYNADDTMHSVTDARGASATYDYSSNNRRLVNGISYSAPSGITPTPNVAFGYDAAGIARA
jgi:YD repeat-containing protein